MNWPRGADYSDGEVAKDKLQVMAYQEEEEKEDNQISQWINSPDWRLRNRDVIVSDGVCCLANSCGNSLYLIVQIRIPLSVPPFVSFPWMIFCF